MGMGGVIDFLFLASGGYLVGTAIMAKSQGSITANVMLGKGVNESDINDKAGFIDFMYKRLLLSGMLIIIASIVHLVNDYYLLSNTLTLIGVVLIVAAIFIYTKAYMDAQRRYAPHKAIRVNREKHKKK